MSIQFATMKNIEIKSSARGTRLGTDVHLEVGGGPGRMGTLVTVRVWIPLDAESTPLSEMQNSLALAVHQVLQEAAAASQADLKRLLHESVTKVPD